MVKINCKEGLMGAFEGMVKVNVGLEWLAAWMVSRAYWDSGIREFGFKEMVKINCKEGLMGVFGRMVKVNVGLEW
jgi:hypothetical protein